MTAPDTPVSPAPPGFDPALFPFTSRWITLSNGAEIHYVDEGHGPLLLLLHGNPTSSFLYRHIILGLRDRFRLVAFDYPGFGGSTAPPGYGFTAAEQAAATIDLAQELGLRDYTIMMQDWAGPIGFALAQRHPDLVAGLVIGNTWAWPLERSGQKIFSRIMGGPIGRAMTWCCNGVVRFFMTKGVVTRLPQPVFDSYLAPFVSRAARRPTVVFPRELRSTAPFLADIYRGLPALGHKPALILWGERDFAFRTPERTRFEQIFTNHTTVLLPQAGHFIQEDAPDQIIAAIADWHPARAR